jgi:hypothetical protein
MFHHGLCLAVGTIGCLYKLDGLIYKVKSKTRFDHLSISYNCEIIVRKI